MNESPAGIARPPRKPNRRRAARCCACLALASSTLAPTGCADEETLREFRDVAASSLESGFKQIFDGLISGAFAAFVVGTDQPAGDGDDAG